MIKMSNSFAAWHRSVKMDVLLSLLISEWNMTGSHTHWKSGSVGLMDCNNAHNGHVESFMLCRHTYIYWPNIHKNLTRTHFQVDVRCVHLNRCCVSPVFLFASYWLKVQLETILTETLPSMTSPSWTVSPMKVNDYAIIEFLFFSEFHC